MQYRKFDVTNSELLFSGHCNYFEKNTAYFCMGVWESVVSSPSGVRSGAPKAKAFLGFAKPQILQKRLKILFG